MKRTLPFVLASLLLAGCVEAPEDAAQDDVIVSPDGKTDVYGRDNRLERFQAPSSYQKWAKSTAVVISGRSLFIDPNDNLRMTATTWSDKLTSTGTGPLCSDERFRSQPAPGFCSAFLIAPDLMATAGHCVNGSYTCEDLRFVFDFAYDQSTSESDVNVVPRANLYQCKEVVGRLFDNYAADLDDMVSREYWSDWSVVRLDRPVSGRTPLRLRASGKPSVGQRVTALGHPGGIPSKVTSGAVVENSHTLYFNTDLDIFAGNSGSVAVNSDGEVEGIVIRGSGGNSFVKDGSCYRSRTCDAYGAGVGCTGNHVMRVDALRPFVELEDIAVANASGGGPVPDGQGDFRTTLQIDATGPIRFVTANVVLAHNIPSDVRIRVVRDTGHAGTFIERPNLKTIVPAYSATIQEFNGEPANGEWTVIVEDLVANGTSYSEVYEVQLVIGIGDAPAPQVEQTFVGSPCTDDGGCDFHADAWCFPYADGSEARGFCTLPCEGYCPDRAGFASTFCTTLDSGVSGSCVARTHAANAYCTALAGTSAQARDRFVGGSTASASVADVCLP